MITVLFIIISIIFVGLGLPDSLFGSAWPAIYKELNLPFSYANFVTMLISAGTVLASFFSARIINKFGTGITTAVSTLTSALALILCFTIMGITLIQFILSRYWVNYEK